MLSMSSVANRTGKMLHCVAAAARAMCESKKTMQPEGTENKQHESSTTGASAEPLDEAFDKTRRVIEELFSPQPSHAARALSEASEPSASPPAGANAQQCHDSLALSPAGLSADELAALRGDALVAAVQTRDALEPGAIRPYISPAHSVISPGGVSRKVPMVPPLPKSESSMGHEADQAGGSPRASPCSSQRAQSQASFGDLPDDLSDPCIMPMHASTPLREETSPWKERPPPSSSICLQHHGSVPPAMIGFLGKGPFWSCDRAAILSCSQRRRGKDTPACDIGPSLPVRQASDTKSTGAAWVEASSTNCAQGSLRSHAARVLCNCVDRLAVALSATADTAPPEEELTTVVLETREQRLCWREFLSEAVSQTSANRLYSAFDVAAEPPRYAKPPMSSATPSYHADAKLLMPRENTVPLVAPHGSGWKNSLDQASTPRIKDQAVPYSPVAKASTPLGSPTVCCSLNSEAVAASRHACMSNAPVKATFHSRVGPAPAG
eukprot:TRINITY_DN44238_c0_g1_i1.p1 TRINITY_DN44238_c0_g1~~TRINITY_DN44238_c0_g1_i1.p1  ORF type:complete len:496 (-),score=55.40 TRINITY_DN44238_c0_g1_i1:4-1491(-)